uniref:Uncharacterized protein n=1 Tax=Haptolina brevifila TaxID=156173 RepID=A0A7S2NH25_9EUKA|mmetsp:Transcript_78423/g.155877  ORF Transcript_78423/g.155877 Transcript_78423/m.155877 type:complete len:100 (+) Transcript_78423:241-540(+)
MWACLAAECPERFNLSANILVMCDWVCRGWCGERLLGGVQIFRNTVGEQRKEQFQTEDAIAQATESCRQQAQSIGDSYRAQREMLCYKCVVLDLVWDGG